MILLLLAISGLCYSANIVLPQQLPAVAESNGLSYAVDLSQSVSYSTFQCIRRYGYTVVFLRGYSPYGQGQVDPSVVSNIRNAYQAGLGTEVYMTPQPNSAKSGSKQFEELYLYLTSAGIKVRTIWVQVTSPINWTPSYAVNTNFIQGILNAASRYRVNVGIYTNVYDWNQITNGLVANSAMLWYWNVFGPGISGETRSDFSDFRSFGGWSTVKVKQFAQVESVCGVTVNRDVYSTSSLKLSSGMSEFVKTQEIVVGGLGLNGTATITEKSHE